MRRLLLLLSALTTTGCGEPCDPVLDILWVRSPDICRDRVSDVEILVDGVNMETGVPVVQHGSEVQITGHVTLNPDAFPDLHRVALRMLHINHRPAGSDESEWANVEAMTEWVGPAYDEFDFPAEIKLDPGEYDIRAYLLSKHLKEDYPTMDYIAQGRVQVVAAAE